VKNENFKNLKKTFKNINKTTNTHPQFLPTNSFFADLIWRMCALEF